MIAGKQTVLLDASSDAVTLQKCVLATDVETLFTDDVTAPYKNALKTCPQTVKKADGEGDILFFTSGTTDSSKAVVRLCVRNALAPLARRVRVHNERSALYSLRRKILQPDDYIRRAVYSQIYGRL